MSNTKEEKVSELVSMLKSNREAKHLAGDSLTIKQERDFTDKCKALSLAIVNEITEGCNVCDCGSSPHGMVQYTDLKGESIPYFEIGCIPCNDTRSQAFTIAKTVDNWNAKKFLAPKPKADPVKE
jgi:hypothetical protein